MIGRLGAVPWAGLTAVIALALLELLARRYFVPGRVSEETYAAYYPAYDYGFDDVPVCWPVGSERVCQPTPYLDVVRQTFPIRRSRNERLVITIGSSVSRGDGTTDYSHVLEAKLQRMRLPARTRIVNLSASSTGSIRQLVRVREAVRYRPDLLVIQVHPENEAKDERDLAYSEELHRGLGGWALRSHAVVALKKYYAEATEADIPAYGARDATDREMDDSAAAWERRERTLEANVDEMLRLAEGMHVRVILVGTTQQVPGFATSRVAQVNDALRARQRDGVGYLDTPAVLEAATAAAPSARLFRDRVHYSGRGHEVVAEALVGPTRAALGL